MIKGPFVSLKENSNLFLDYNTKDKLLLQKIGRLERGSSDKSPSF